MVNLEDILNEIDFSMIPMSKDEFVEWFDDNKDSVKDARSLWVDLDTQVVSAVENPSHDSAFVSLKSEGDTEQNVNGVKMLKASDGDEKQIAYAPAMVPDQLDKDGDIVPSPIVEKSAHSFLEELRNGEIDADHETPINFDNSMTNRGTVVESWVLDTSKEMETIDDEVKNYPKGTWMIGVKFKNEVWERIKSGEISGYSIMGTPKALDLNQETKTFNKGENNNTSMTDNTEESEVETEDTEEESQEEFNGFDREAIVEDITSELRDDIENMVKDITESEQSEEEESEDTEESEESEEESEDTEDSEESEDDSKNQTVEDMTQSLADEFEVEYDTLMDTLEEIKDKEGYGNDDDEDEDETEESEKDTEDNEESEKSEKDTDPYSEIVRKVSVEKQGEEDADSESEEKSEEEEEELDPYEQIVKGDV